MANQQVSGEFEVQMTPVSAADAPVGQMALNKTYRGALEARSMGQMLAVRTATEGSAGYVAMEKVTGTLDGRRGTFVLQHAATMTRGEPWLAIQITPDSGTDDLSGLSGSMNIRIEGGKHFYDLDYSLPD